jgi:hypothetical protein
MTLNYQVIVERNLFSKWSGWRINSRYEIFSPLDRRLKRKRKRTKKNKKTKSKNKPTTTTTIFKYLCEYKANILFIAWKIYKMSGYTGLVWSTQDITKMASQQHDTWRSLYNQ